MTAPVPRLEKEEPERADEDDIARDDRPQVRDELQDDPQRSRDGKPE